MRMISISSSLEMVSSSRTFALIVAFIIFIPLIETIPKDLKHRSNIYFDYVYFVPVVYQPSYQVVDSYEPYKENPNLKCPANSEYTDCMSPCPWTCDRIKDFQFFAVSGLIVCHDIILLFNYLNFLSGPCLPWILSSRL